MLERFVAGYQRTFGSFTDLTDYVAVVSRAFPALPAILPLSAKAMLTTAPAKAKTRTLQEHSSIGRRDWNGFSLTTIQHTDLDETGKINRAITYLLRVGDVAVLSDDLNTIGDLLSSPAKESARLENSLEFREAIGNQGEVVYFSDITALLPSKPVEKGNEKLSESGALRISKSAWENSFHLTFAESDWSKALIPFQPKELISPRELLPASTVAYYMMKIDVPAAWEKFARPILSEKETAALGETWKLDFVKSVLPELGPECGVGLLDLPDLSDSKTNSEWVAFCQTRSGKIGQLLAAGELLSPAGSANGIVEVKAADGFSYFFALRKGFLVIASSSKAMATLEAPEKLLLSRSYQKAMENVPDGIVAFGGYNVDAAVASVPETAADGLRGQAASVPRLFARAFHSQRFFATATAGTVEAKSSVSMDREGRYAVAEIAPKADERVLTYATLEPRGLAIDDPQRISRLALRVRAKVPGVIERIKEDVNLPQQNVSAVSEHELILSVEPRRASGIGQLKLPINEANLTQYLQATREIPSNDKNVVARAQEIAGKDRDAWSVAQKLAAWTHKNLEWKFVASADAAQTLATREADCSEFSQLYVAMARALGLPARVVSGLAYTGSSFGAHAWVEVWIGRWVELDPTWGTDFVDATHIRNETGALITYAALNAVELEVVDARRDVANFQSSARALTDKLITAIPSKDLSVLVPALDLSALVDRMSGNGTWQSMTEAEHERMSSVYRRALMEIINGYGQSDGGNRKLRLLHLDEAGDSATATCLLAPEDLLLKLTLFRRDRAWYLADISQAEVGLDIVNEILRPTLEGLTAQRTVGSPTTVAATPFLRVLMLLEKDPAKAIAIADKALAQDSSNQPVRFLKALALFDIEERRAEGRELIIQLTKDPKPYAPAVFKLANLDAYEQDVNKRMAVVELYQHYLKLEPYDCRAYSRLARQFEYLNNTPSAEAAYHKAVECDPSSEHRYTDLAIFFAGQKRWIDVAAVLANAETKAKDIFSDVMRSLSYEDEPAVIEAFAASQPQRMRKSSAAHLLLAQVKFDKGQKVSAISLVKKAIALEPQSSEGHLVLSEFYRGMSRWRAALQAAETALALDEKNARGHFDRACALARLGKTEEAITALNRAIEIEPYYSESLADEPDLKPLSNLPAFKKLIAEETNQ
jgi:transglutaminase-like putative cysteine protease/Tfp pilus assembly protein PilF